MVLGTHMVGVEVGVGVVTTYCNSSSRGIQELSTTGTPRISPLTLHILIAKSNKNKSKKKNLKTKLPSQNPYKP